MAKQVIDVTDLVINDGVDVKHATIKTDLAGCMYIAAADLKKDGKVAIHVKQAGAFALTVTVKNGVFQGAKGALAETVVASTGEKMFVLDSASFRQADGAIYIDMSATAALNGTVCAYKLP